MPQYFYIEKRSWEMLTTYVKREFNAMNQNYQKEDRLFGKPQHKAQRIKEFAFSVTKLVSTLKGKDVREKLIQCIDLRADENIRKTALAKNDSTLCYCVTRFCSSWGMPSRNLVQRIHPAKARNMHILNFIIYISGWRICLHWVSSVWEAFRLRQE